MRLYICEKPPHFEKSVIAMGMFDGCHNGHRQVLLRAIKMARELSCPCIAWTYSRHPLSVIRPESAPEMLQDTHERIRQIAQTGVDAICLNNFTEAMATISAKDFVCILHERLGMRGIALGHSHTFGAGAKGNEGLLREMGKERGFKTEVAETLLLCGEPVHSSAIREHLRVGRLREASAMLGRSYSLSGKIIGGRKLGRKLGFPTINISVPSGRLLPRFGVYAAYADIGGNSYPCILNIGVKPTVGVGDISAEAYLLDFTGDLYGEQANIRFFQFMRQEIKFPSFDALSAQISRDEARAREIIGLTIS